MTVLSSYADVTDRLSAGLYAVVKAPRTPPSIFVGEADDVWVNLSAEDGHTLSRAELWVTAGEAGAQLFAADHAFRVDTPKKLRLHGNSSFLVAGDDATVYRALGSHLTRLPGGEHIDEADFWAAVDPGSVLIIWDSQEFIPF